MDEFWKKVFLAAFQGRQWDSLDDAVNLSVMAANRAVKECPKEEHSEPPEEGGWISVKGGWISVDDGLPREGQYVLIHLTNTNWQDSADPTGVYHKVAALHPCPEEGNNGRPYRWDSFGPSMYFGQEVDFWMELPPLPDPPEEESVFVSIPCRGCSCCKSRGLTPLPEPPEATP